MPHLPNYGHEPLMRRCIELATLAYQHQAVPVGALIVRDDVILADARETLPSHPDIIGHAELLAIRAACFSLNRLDLSGFTLYTTAEPCWMCSYAIREAGLSQVVVGSPTPHIGGISSAYPILQTTDVPHWGSPPEIITGVLEAECRALRDLPKP